MKNENKKIIGILTGGGDCPGLNAVIRAVVKEGSRKGFKVLGIEDGWQGLVGKTRTRELKEKDVRGIINKGGTILGSSTINPLKIKNGKKQIIENVKNLDLKALVVVGGDGTFAIGRSLPKNFPIIAIPKTIDNDVLGTDFCIGFWSAVETATKALDNLRTTASSHHRAMVLEVMGRDFGWIATYAGLAGGADYIFIPESKINVDKVCKAIEERTKKGKRFSLVIVSEGAELKRGLSGDVGEQLASLIKKNAGVVTRSVNLGHIVRGGIPCSFDRVLAGRMGVRAVEEISKGKIQIGVGLKGDEIITVPFSKMRGGKKTNMEVYKTASVFFN
jgi:6-phosphofructokinase 1